MKPVLVVVLIVLAAVVGFVVGATLRPALSERRTPEIDGEILMLRDTAGELEEIAARLASIPPMPATRNAVPAEEPSDLGAEETGIRSDLEDLRAEVARLAELVERAPSSFHPDPQNLHEVFVSAPPPNWTALQELGCAVLEDKSTAQDRVAFLRFEDVLSQFGRPTRTNGRNSGGQLWRYTRDTALLGSAGDVHEIKFDFDSRGYVMSAWGVKILSSR